MYKLYVLFATSLCAFLYGQNYDVSEVPEALVKNASVVIREKNTVLNITKIDQMTFDVHSVMTVLNKDGSKYSTPAISYERGEKISNVKATLYDKNGNRIKTFSKSDFKDFSNNFDGTFHSDSRLMVLPLSATDYPYTVEFAYTYQTESTVFIPDFTPFNTQHVSLQNSSFTINNASGIDLREKIYPSPYNFTEVISNNEGKTSEYRYQNIPALTDEPFAPDPEKILPKVSFALSSFNLKGKQGNLQTWEDFGKWYYSSLLSPVSAVTPEIKAEVAALNLKGTTSEKVKTLFQFMQQKTRYVFVALGIGGWQPMLAQEVQQKGYGDCKALTNYMKTLLDAAGIPSYYSIIWSNPSSVSFDKDFPKMAGNHVILVVPTENGNIWLENTSQAIAFNHLGGSTTARNVLAVKPDGINILQTPSYSADQSKEVIKMNLMLAEDNSVSSDMAVKLTGSQYDFGMPLVLLGDKERADFLKTHWSTLHFDKATMKDFRNDKDRAEISYLTHLKAVNYAKSVGSDKIFRVVPVFSNVSLLSSEDRMLPFEQRFDLQDEYHFNFKIPEGYTISAMPQNVDIKSEFGNYSLKIKIVNGSNIAVERVLRMNKGIHPKEKYNDYITFRKIIMSNDNAKVMIKKN